MAGFSVLCLLAASAASGWAMSMSPELRKEMTPALVSTDTFLSTLNNYRLMDEVAHWKDSGMPLYVKFETDSGTYELTAVENSMQARTLDQLKPKELVKFYLFTKFDESGMTGEEFTFDKDLTPEMNLKKLTSLGFDTKAITKVIIHDFGKSVKAKDMVMMRNAYLKKGKYNVLFVDWSNLARFPDYFMARAVLPKTGEYLGSMLDFLKTVLSEESAKKIHVIGAGLGAHLAGIASKHMERGRVFRITGLDPTAVLFQRAGQDVHLHASDAQNVDVIHTNANGLGMAKALGTSDFYPNGGKFQPGCDWEIHGACAHARAVQYFIESIQDEKKFKSTLCKGLSEALKGDCRANVFANMGEGDEFSMEGLFFTKTNEKAPFSF